MRRLKIQTVISGMILVLSVVLIVLFPREIHPALSTVLAIVFWLSLLATAFFVCLLIHNFRRKQKWQKERFDRRNQPSAERPKSRSPANTQNRVHNVNSHNGGKQNEQV